MKLDASSVFCDLGSGLGKSVAFAFMGSECKGAIGVELSVTRHNQVKKFGFV